MITRHCAFDGIAEECSFMSFFRAAKPIRQTITTKQPDCLKQCIKEKPPSMANRRRVTHPTDHDSVGPHISLAACQKLSEINWDGLPQPHCSPPTDCFLFWSLENSLDGNNFEFVEVIENYLDHLNAKKPTEFRGSAIEKLPWRLARVIANGGQYIIYRSCIRCSLLVLFRLIIVSFVQVIYC